MWHRVAALLGSTVAELQQRMSSEEFVRWCAFYSIEPWGYELDKWLMGMTCSTVANVAGVRKKAFKPSDFYPKRRRTLTPEESRRALEAARKNG